MGEVEGGDEDSEVADEAEADEDDEVVTPVVPDAVPVEAAEAAPLREE